MATVKLTASFTSVQASKPSTSFYALARTPIKVDTKEVLTRVDVLAKIPVGSLITSATYRVAQDDDWSGSITMALRRNLVAWYGNDTWNTKPSVVSTPTDSTTEVDTTKFNYWEFDVTSDVQGWISRTVPYNWGWTLRTSSSTLHYLRGRKATSHQPHVVIEYEPPAKTPTNLSPQGGAVSVADPVLTFQSSDSMTALQVQIDPAADAGSPDFDSGEVAATGGYLDLADTAYAGLVDGATTYWRARAKSGAGWSAWSTWVSFSRSDLDTVTLTAPATTTADTTPPFTWTFGGTQTAWQADLILVSPRRLLRSSGLRSGADNDWTATPLVGDYFGQLLEARVRVWDDVTRIATPGAPTYSEDTVQFTAGFTTDVDPMDTLAATQTAPSPGIVLTGTRAAGIPDEVAIFHDGELVARMDGADVFTTATDFEFTDWWARMGREVVISVVAIVNGEFADESPEATLTPTCSGLWLVEPASGTAAVLWDKDAGEWTRNDVATEHLAVTGQIVRRRLANPPRSGSISGQILDIPNMTADSVLAAFEEFVTFDASTTYRLIAGQMNLSVLAGNFLTVPTPNENTGNEVRSRGQFSWWGADEPVIVDGG